MTWLPTMQWDEQQFRRHTLPPLLSYLTGSNVCFIKIRVMWFYRNDPWLVWYDEIIHRLRGFLKYAAIFWSGRFDGGDMQCVCWLRIVVTACYVSSSLLLYGIQVCGYVCLSLRFKSSFKMSLWGYTLEYRILITEDYMSVFCFWKM